MYKYLFANTSNNFNLLVYYFMGILIAENHYLPMFIVFLVGTIITAFNQIKN